MLKNSKQREAIRAVLMETKSHPSAETVFQMLKATYPNISLATVYRNLNLLTELGEITKVPGTTGSDRFDGNVAPHIHFFCTDCNAILDLPSSEDDADKDEEIRFKKNILNYIEEKMDIKVLKETYKENFVRMIKQ